MNLENNLARRESTASSRSSNRSAARGGGGGQRKSPSPALIPLLQTTGGGRLTPSQEPRNQPPQPLNGSMLSNGSRRSNNNNNPAAPKISPKTPNRNTGLNNSVLSNGSKRSTSSRSSRNGRPPAELTINDVDLTRSDGHQNPAPPDRFEVILEQQTETETEDETDFDQEEQDEEERNEQVEILTKLITGRIDHTATQETNAVIYIIDALKLYREPRSRTTKALPNLGCVVVSNILLTLAFYVQLGLLIWLSVVSLLSPEEGVNLTGFLVILGLVILPSLVLVLFDCINIIKSCGRQGLKALLIDIVYLPAYLVKIDLIINVIQKILYEKQIRRVTKRKFRRPLQVKLDGLDVTIEKTLFIHVALTSTPLSIYLMYLFVQRLFGSPMMPAELQNGPYGGVGMNRDEQPGLNLELEHILQIVCTALAILSMSLASMFYSTKYVNEFKTASSLLHRNLNDYQLASVYVKLLRFLSNTKLILVRLVPFVLFANYWPWLLLIVYPGHLVVYFITNLVLGLSFGQPLLTSAHNSSPCSPPKGSTSIVVLNAIVTFVKTFTFYETFDILSIHYIFYHCFLFVQAVIIFIFYFLKADTNESVEIKIYLTVALSVLFVLAVLIEIVLKTHLSSTKERLVVSKLLSILKSACSSNYKPEIEQEMIHFSEPRN